MKSQFCLDNTWTLGSQIYSLKLRKVWLVSDSLKFKKIFSETTNSNDLWSICFIMFWWESSWRWATVVSDMTNLLEQCMDNHVSNSGSGELLVLKSLLKNEVEMLLLQGYIFILVCTIVKKRVYWIQLN
jgi:hypothetical protein